jgi:hypothetical protein
MQPPNPFELSLMMSSRNAPDTHQLRLKRHSSGTRQSQCSGVKQSRKNAAGLGPAALHSLTYSDGLNSGIAHFATAHRVSDRTESK